MDHQSHTDIQNRLPRLAAVAGTLLAGLAACGALLALLAGPVPRASAAAASAVASISANFPGSAPCDTTLQACIDGLTPGDTIIVQPGTYVTDALTLNKAVNLTGVSSDTVILQAMTNQRVLSVTGAAVNSSVVISGLTFAGGHAVGADCPAGCGGAILITATAQPQLINVTLRNNQADYQGGALYADTGSPLVLSGAAVLSNTAFSYGGAINSTESITVTDSLFQNNQCTGTLCGGAALLTDGNLTVGHSQFISNTGTLYGAVMGQWTAAVSDSLFQNDSCSSGNCHGGGLWAIGPSVLANTQFLTNTSTGWGAGLAAIKDVTLSVGLFQNNQCTSNCFGGGLFTEGHLVLTGTHFFSNPASFNGGAIFDQANADLTDGVFWNNFAGSSGGGLFAFGNVNMTDTQFMSNTADDSGGGFNGNSTAMVVRGVFQDNQCINFDCAGAGLSVNGNLQMSQVQVLSNTSGGFGGGAAAIGPATIVAGVFQNNRAAHVGGGLVSHGSLVITGTQFLSNTTASDGGGLFLRDGDARLVNVLFAANQASGQGDALNVSFAGTVSVLHTTIASPTVGSGSAIYVTNSTVGITDTLIASDTIGIENGGGTVYEDYNLFSGVTTPISPTGSPGPHSRTGAADFIDPADGDYHIRSSSAAWHLGTDVGVRVDFDGDPRPTYGGFDAGYDQVIHTIPRVADDAYNPAENITLTVAAPGVLGNDSDADLDPITALLGQGVATGTLDLAPSGAFTYVTTLNFTGVVTFTYAASDGVFTSTPALVTITVGDLPISGLALAGTSPTVLGSATSFTASLASGSHITYTWNFGDGGPALIVPSLVITHAYSAPGSYQAVVTATNTLGHQAANAVVIVDDRPVAANDFYTATAGAPQFIAAAGVLQNDADGYPGPLTAQLVSGPSAGVLVLAPSGVFTLTLPSGYTGVITFTYRASDGILLSAPAVARLTIDANRLFLPLVER